MKGRRLRILASAALAFLFLEIGTRLALPWLIRHSATYNFLRYADLLVKGDPVLIAVGRPRAAAQIPNSTGESVSYQLNSVGWRDDEFNPLAATGNALALGDAETFGLGVPAGRRYTEFLEGGFHGLRIWNAGMIGYAPDQQLLMAERWLPPVPWRFVVAQFSARSLHEVAEHDWRSVSPESGVPAELKRVWAYSLFSRYSEAWNLLVNMALWGNGRASESTLADGLQRLLFSVRETAKLAAWRHIPMIVVQSGWGEARYGSKVAQDYRDGLTALAREQVFTLLDVGVLPQQPFPDLHWTVESHHKVAELLFPKVKELILAQNKVTIRPDKTKKRSSPAAPSHR